MGIRLQELARLVEGQQVDDCDVEITGASILRDARPGDITFADSHKFIPQLAASSATAAIVPLKIQFDGKPTIRVADVHKAFATIVRHFRPSRVTQAQGISPAACISSSAQIAANATVHPYAFIGDDVVVGERCVIHAGARVMAGCRLGQDVVIFPNAVLYEDTFVGDRCIVHANAVIGAYGFGYHTTNGQHQLSSQLGNVELGCDVEVGACATIDRGTYSATRIGEGTKIDNQVQIAHNCRIGRHNLLCSQVGIAGSCTTGDYVVMAGQVGIKDHVNIADRVILGAQSGVMRDVPEGSVCFGSPATLERDQMHIVAALTRLPEMRRQLRALEHRVADLGGQHKPRPQQEAA